MSNVSRDFKAQINPVILIEYKTWSKETDPYSQFAHSQGWHTSVWYLYIYLISLVRSYELHKSPTDPTTLTCGGLLYQWGWRKGFSIPHTWGMPVTFQSVCSKSSSFVRREMPIAASSPQLGGSYTHWHFLPKLLHELYLLHFLQPSWSPRSLGGFAKIHLSEVSNLLLSSTRYLLSSPSQFLIYRHVPLQTASHRQSEIWASLKQASYVKVEHIKHTNPHCFCFKFSFSKPYAPRRK